MRKRRTSTKTVETLKNVASNASEAVKNSGIPDAVEKTVEKTVDKIDKIAEQVPETAEKVADKMEEFMNAPIIEEGKEKIQDVAEKASAAVRTRISEVTLEIFETSVSLDAIQKAVKKNVSSKKLKGEIKVYINAEERAAYYTVDGRGDGSNKIDLRKL